MNNLLASVGIDIGMLVKIVIVIASIVIVVIIAKIIAALIGKLIKKADFLKKLFKKIGVKLDLKLISKVVSKVLYILLILSAVIGGLAYLGVIGQNSLDNFLGGYITPAFTALGLAIVAWFIAVFTKAGIIKLLSSTDLDEKLGDENSKGNISESLATVGYWGVIVFFLPEILNKLGQKELLSPITDIIKQITGFIPQLISAGIIIAISYFIGKIIAKIVTDVLSGLGFDKVLSLIGLKNANSKTTPSTMIGKLVFIYILLLAILEAADKIGFGKLSEIVNLFLGFATNVLIGIVIFGIGMFLASLASNAIKSTSDSKFLPKIAKAAIIILTSFMGLQQMGLGGDIITQAFTLLLGACAVAFSLAVGLGSKEVAGKEVEAFIERMKK